MQALACVTCGYLIGTINPAFLFGKMKGFDVRQRGSGNAGATNVLLTMGKLFGVICALLDIMKAYLSCRIAKLLFPALGYAGVLAGVACVLGHIFPVWMGFRGGKGLACLAGVVIAHSWKLFCVLLALEIVLTLAINYICVMAMSASAIFTVIYAVSTRDLVGTFALLLMTMVIEFKHLDNVKRIMAGTEFHVSYLWNKDKEIERVTKILGEERVDELV